MAKIGRRRFPPDGSMKKKTKWVPEKQLAWPYKGNRVKKILLIGKQGKSSPAQSLKAQPQKGWTAQSARTSQTNIKNPVEGWWKALVFITIVILVAIVIYYAVMNMVLGTNNEGGGGNAGDCTCYCGDDITVCTSNSQCPSDTSVPGTNVPGVCGCPVGC